MNNRPEKDFSEEMLSGKQQFHWYFLLKDGLPAC